MGSIPGGKDPLEEGIATHSSILACRIPWTEESGGLQSIGSQSWTWLKQLSMNIQTHAHMHAPRCKGRCVSGSVKHYWVALQISSIREIAKKKKKKEKKQHSNTLFFLLFTYIKYIGKSAVAFCYHDCYVGRGRKGEKGKCFLRGKKKKQKIPPLKNKQTDQKKKWRAGK